MFKYFYITILSCAVFLKPLSAEEIKDGLYQEFFENKSPNLKSLIKMERKMAKKNFGMRMVKLKWKVTLKMVRSMVTGAVV